MLPLFLLNVGQFFQFSSAVGEWKITEILSDEKIIAEEQRSGRHAWFWSNRLVELLNP